MTTNPQGGVQQRTVSDDEAELRFDRWCKKHFPALAHGQLQKLMRSGQFRLDGKRVKGSERLAAGQIIRIPPQATGLKQKGPRPINPHDEKFLRSLFLYEDDQVIVLNKPTGLAVQGGSKTTRHIDGMLDALTKNGRRPRLVHRLDRDTSGILVLARDAPTARELMHAFQGHSVRKLYWALVAGRPEREAGLIDLKLGKSGPPGAERMTPDALDAKRAQTDFRVLLHAGKIATWVGLMPLTGRTHQLRVHMAAIGNPILGDAKYGAPDAETRNAPPGLMLHAREISFQVGRRTINVVAPPSEIFLTGMKWLGLPAQPVAFSKIVDWGDE